MICGARSSRVDSVSGLSSAAGRGGGSLMCQSGRESNGRSAIDGGFDGDCDDGCGDGRGEGCDAGCAAGSGGNDENEQVLLIQKARDSRAARSGSRDLADSKLGCWRAGWRLSSSTSCCTGMPSCFSGT